MALDDLIARLEQEAHARVDAIARDADADVRSIEAVTEQLAADVTAGHLDREHASRLVVQQRELAAARQHARARILGARRAQLARVFDRARALIDDTAASPSFLAALAAHLDEALCYLEGVPSRVRCRAVLAPLLEAAITRYPDATLVVDESVGIGLTAEANDGSVVVDNTVIGRLSRAEPRLTIELSRKLAYGGD